MKRVTTLLLAAVAGAGMMSSAYAADLIVEQPAYIEPVMVNNWDGPYVGVFGGFGWGRLSHDDDWNDEFCLSDDCDFDVGGWLIGLTAGANFSMGTGFVLGVAGDIAWADLSDDANDFFWDGEFDTLEDTIGWEGSLRGVAGWDGGGFMPYLTAGLAVAGHTTKWDDGFDDWDSDSTHVGWTAGVGMAFAVADNLSIDLQYRYSWYGDEDIDLPDNIIWDGDTSINLNTSRLTVGVNWGF